MHGKGKMNWGNGKYYEGDFVFDMKHGYGIFYWGDGRIYSGEWRDGK